MAQVEGKTVKIGDYVGFKCDIEQGGTIKKINWRTLTLTSISGFDGDYIGGQTETDQLASDCWLEE